MTSVEGTVMTTTCESSITSWLTRGGSDPYSSNVSYQQQWKDHLALSEPQVTLYDTCIIDEEEQDPSSPGGGGGLLVGACDSNGRVSVWRLPLQLTNDEQDQEYEWDETTTEGSSSTWSTSSLLKPLYQWKLCEGALYKLQIILQPSTSRSTHQGTAEPSATAASSLWVSGEGCGILVYDWTQLLLSNNSYIQPKARYKPYPSPIYLTSVRDFSLSDNHSILTAAADDEWGLYQWNLETGTRRLTTKHKHGPVTCVCQVGIVLLVGSQKGVVGVYDENGQLTAELDLGQLLLQQQLQNQQQPPQQQHLLPPEVSVSSVAIVSDCWWTVAGGFHTKTSNTASGNGGGFLATFHAPSRSLVHHMLTRETPSRLALSSPSAKKKKHQSLLSIISHQTSLLSRVHPISLETVASWRCCYSGGKSSSSINTQTTPSCCWALSVHDKVTVVGGVGGRLDVHDNTSTTRILALTTKRQTESST